MKRRRSRHGISLDSRVTRFGIALCLAAGVVVLTHGAPRSTAVGTPAIASIDSGRANPTPVLDRGSSSPERSAGCRRDPLAGVYHPWRLKVNEACLTVSGTVERVRTEPDHDWHINLRLAPGSRNLTNAENRKWEHGDLVVEVIPMDQPFIPRPKPGERISVTGAYVLDTDHGWEEIHPAWIINGKGRLHFTAREARQSVAAGIRGNAEHFGRRRSND